MDAAAGSLQGRRELMSSVKSRLTQIRRLDCKINMRIAQAEELISITTGTRSPILGDKVQTSLSGDRMADAVVRYADMQRDIDDMIDGYVRLKSQIISEIEEVEDSRYMYILYDRYVRFLSFDAIADSMGYTVHHVLTLHGAALQAYAAVIGEHEAAETA